MHTVKRAAELTGLTPDTLRAWERRYAVVTPERSTGGYRLYDDLALRRLAAMKSLVDAGWSPSQAAARAVADVEAVGDVRAGSSAEGEETVGDLDALALAGRDMDAAALTRALDEGFASGSFEQVVDGWLMPSLTRLGAAWRAGWVGVAGEHFVSAGVQRRIAAQFEAAALSETGPTVVVGLARGSRHELGVLAFAVAVRRAGMTVAYVGSDLPPEAWLDVVRRRQAAAVVIGVPSVEDVPAVRETVQTLRRSHPDLPIHLGGGHQDRIDSAGVHHLGHLIAPGARAVAEGLRAARS